MADENLNMTLEKVFRHIEDSAKGSESEDDFSGLFAIDVSASFKHLSDINDDGEQLKDSTVSRMEIVQQEGARYEKR